MYVTLRKFLNSSKTSNFLYQGVIVAEKAEKHINFSKFLGLRVEKSKKVRIFQNFQNWIKIGTWGLLGLRKPKIGLISKFLGLRVEKSKKVRIE